MAAAAILEKFRVAISPQPLTIHLYSAHRAVIFAIAQLSCYIYDDINVLQGVNSSLCLDTVSARMGVGHLLLPAQLPGTH